MRYSEEQEAIFRAPQGFNVAVANAGTGKCVHPSMRVEINGQPMTMGEIWEKYAEEPVKMGEGWYAFSSKKLKTKTRDGHQWKVIEVTALYRQFVNEALVVIGLHTGERLICTQQHRPFDGTEYIRAEEVREGMQLAKPERNTAEPHHDRDYRGRHRRNIFQETVRALLEEGLEFGTVISVQHLQYRGWVYDLSVLPTRNYVVEGILTHNTECCAEFFVRHYMEEERKMFPRLGKDEHATGRAQDQMFKLFRVVTFTRKAAQNLDERIMRKLERAGVIIGQDGYGRDRRICRTLDSYLASWHRNPLVFSNWCKLYPERVGSLSAWLGRSLPEEEARRWVWHAPEKLTNLLWLGLHGNRRGFPINLDTLIEEGRERARRNPDIGRAHQQVLASLEQAILETHGPYLEMDRERKHPGCSPGRRKEIEEKLVLWSGVQKQAQEAAGLYDFVRSRGYRPETPGPLVADAMLNQIALTDWASVVPLHELMTEYDRVKTRSCILDYQDLLEQIHAVMRDKTSRWVMDRANEYPRYGIRAKYVIWDETQDNNPYQFWVLRMLCGTADSGYKCLAIGDPKQSIYHFRGATPGQFNGMIERQLEKAPGQVFTLSRSFRSSQAVVALGNEIARILPERPGMVVDSDTIHEEEGFIRCAPPIRTEAEITEWVKARVAEIRRDQGKDVSVYFLVRANKETHPLAKWSLDQDNIEMMTIHAAKGLEADYVFVLGLVAGQFPDVRCQWDQEANLMYVAATRARTGLYLCPHLVTEETDKQNHTTHEVESGPSPFFLKVPGLKKAAMEAGWSEEKLRGGLLTHKEKQAIMLSQITKNIVALKESAARIEAKKPVWEILTDENNEVLQAIIPTKKSQTKITLEGRKAQTPKSAITLTSEEIAKLRKELGSHFIRNKTTRGISKERLEKAEHLGWVGRAKNGYAFTPLFNEALKEAARPPAKAF